MVGMDSRGTRACRAGRGSARHAERHLAVHGFASDRHTPPAADCRASTAVAVVSLFAPVSSIGISMTIGRNSDGPRLAPAQHRWRLIALARFWCLTAGRDDRARHRCDPESAARDVDLAPRVEPCRHRRPQFGPEERREKCCAAGSRETALPYVRVELDPSLHCVNCTRTRAPARAIAVAIAARLRGTDRNEVCHRALVRDGKGIGLKTVPPPNDSNGDGSPFSCSSCRALLRGYLLRRFLGRFSQRLLLAAGLAASCGALSSAPAFTWPSRGRRRRFAGTSPTTGPTRATGPGRPAPTRRVQVAVAFKPPSAASPRNQPIRGQFIVRDSIPLSKRPANDAPFSLKCIRPGASPV